MNQKLAYLMTASKKFVVGDGRECPSCGASQSMLIDKKYMVTALRRCKSCSLLFRTPTTTPAENASFYQSNYTEGFTTEMPSADKLKHLLDSKFKNEEKDYTRYINLLEALGAKKGDSLFDFGCSWGYGSWQFGEHGFNVDSFEISKPRASYAKDKLHVNVHTTRPDVRDKYDIFFSSHVIEHVPSVNDVIDYAKQVLKPGGLFVALTPNGSEEYRKANAHSWHKLWGLVHPNFLDKTFYQNNFGDCPYIIGSTPCDLNQLQSWVASTEKNQQTLLDLSGGELFFAARV